MGFFINFHLFLQHHLTVFKAYYEAMGYLEFEISNNCKSAFGSKELCKIVQNIVAPIMHVQKKKCIHPTEITIMLRCYLPIL